MLTGSLPSPGCSHSSDQANLSSGKKKSNQAERLLPVKHRVCSQASTLQAQALQPGPEFSGEDAKARLTVERDSSDSLDQHAKTRA